MSERVEVLKVEQIDRGLTYAESCFETFRVIDGEIFAWSSHWERLCHGIAAFGITLQTPQKTIVLQACLAQASQASTDCLLRLTCSGGDAQWGLTQPSKPKFWIQTSPFIAAQPIDVVTTTYPFALQPRTAKFTADYAQTLRAIQIWQQQQPHINPQQYIICKDHHVISGLTSNILLYIQGQWLTPQGDGVLHGVVRNFLLHQGLIKEALCSKTLLHNCEAALLINSGHFLRLISSINQRTLAHQHPAFHSIYHALSTEKGVSLEPL